MCAADLKTDHRDALRAGRRGDLSLPTITDGMIGWGGWSEVPESQMLVLNKSPNWTSFACCTRFLPAALA